MQEGANETSHLGRALALALCTLWGNILFLDGSGSVLLSAPFASRMASMAFSVVGFAAAWLVARSCTASPMRCRVALLGVCALLSSAGSFLHFSGVAWLPESIDWVPTAVFSVAFAFLLVACGEVYAEISAGRAVVYASVSYMLAYLGSTVVVEMGLQIVCVVETLLPLAVFVLVVQPVRSPASDGPAKGMPVPLAKLVSVTLEAIPARVLAAIGITYFAIGSTLAQSGAPLDYFTWQTAIAAVLTSVVVMVTCILLHGRVALTSLYKILMVGQVLAAFLLSEWAEGAQIAVVITFVGVKIVAWALMAELALLARARGTAPAALVYAAGCLAGHIGEGLAGVLSVFGFVNQGVLLIVVVALLVGAAAFLFTGEMGKYPDISDVAPASDGGEGTAQVQAGSPCDGPRPSRAEDPVVAQAAQPSLDERIGELASSYMLSARETEVFRLWATGHTLKYIQEKLYLSPSTVKTHVRHIYDKTGVHSRSEIVELLDPLADKR